MFGNLRNQVQRAIRIYGDGPPEDLRTFYARDGEYGRQRVTIADANSYSFRHGLGNPPTKRGYEFFAMPYFDERTGRLHTGDPTILLSQQTKDDLREIVEMCRRSGIQVEGPALQLIDYTETAPSRDKQGRQIECDTCQGQHATEVCRYPCHYCITEGPCSAHICHTKKRFSNISQDRIRGQSLYQVWPPGKARDESGRLRAHYTIRRRPYFRPIPHGWQEVFEAACRRYNGEIKIVHNNAYKEWRRGLEEKKEMDGPFHIQAPYRMMGLHNIQHSVELMEKVYLKVAEARQMVRHKCPDATLKLRRYRTGQREPGGEIRFENLQEIKEVIVRLEDYRPDEEPLHAELGSATPGSAYYIYPHGRFELDDNRSPKVPRYTNRQVLQKHPYHPDGNESKYELVFDAFGKHFSLHSDIETYAKKPREVFMKHLDAFRLAAGERDRVSEAFEMLDAHFTVDKREFDDTSKLMDAGIAPCDVEELAYEHTGTDESGQQFYVKVSADEFQRRVKNATEIPVKLYPTIQRLFESAVETKKYSAADCSFYTGFKALPLSYDQLLAMAYYVESQPMSFDLDVGMDEGLMDLEWTLDVYKAYLAYIEDPQKAQENGIVELLGPHGLGCLRVPCECFLGGPSTNAAARQVFEQRREAPSDPAKSLWPRPHSEAEMKRFMKAVLGFEPNDEQWQALEGMVLNRLFVLIGMPGSGKTELTCAAVLYLMFVFGERILLLTETNHGASDTRNTLAKMLQVVETTYAQEINAARGRMRARIGPKGTYRWVTHSLAGCREYEEEETKTDRVGLSKGRKLCQVSRIVVSTLGHARSKAVQLFEADTIVIDEAARSTTPRIMSTLLERWLNTSPTTTRIHPDEDDDGGKTKLWNPHAAQQLILVGDPAQGLPQMLVPPITDKKVAWDVGEYDNMMTILMNCGAPFVRLNRSFRMSYWGIQPILDRY